MYENKKNNVLKYLKNIEMLFEKPKLKIFSTIYVNKIEIDDLMCCIYSILPNEFKISNDNLKSSLILKNINKLLKKTMISSSLYSCNYLKMKNLIKVFKIEFNKDIKKLG